MLPLGGHNRSRGRERLAENVDVQRHLDAQGRTRSRSRAIKGAALTMNRGARNVPDAGNPALRCDSAVFAARRDTAQFRLRAASPRGYATRQLRAGNLDSVTLKAAGLSGHLTKLNSTPGGAVSRGRWRRYLARYLLWGQPGPTRAFSWPAFRSTSSVRRPCWECQSRTSRSVARN
jgi:hypothetical protein